MKNPNEKPPDGRAPINYLYDTPHNHNTLIEIYYSCVVMS